MHKKYTLPDIPAAERTPLVELLLAVITELQTQVDVLERTLAKQEIQLAKQEIQLAKQEIQLAKQAHEIDVVRSELNRVKGLKNKPTIKPSKLPKNKGTGSDKDDNNAAGGGSSKRPGSDKRSKHNQLTINQRMTIESSDVPAGSIRNGYQQVIVQELEINSVVTQYRLARWRLPDGGYHVARLPEALQGQHFGPKLRSYILYQYHHQCVTQPLLYEQLREWGIDISKGQINRILTEAHAVFHEEKAALLSTGLSVSSYIHVDDTGARHQGVNGYCTHIGNEFFAWFKSARHKSRINFLELLQTGQTDYCLVAESFAYMKRYKVTAWVRQALKRAEGVHFTASAWLAFLDELNIKTKHYRRLVTEAGLIGALLATGFNKDLVIVSDDAGQFNIFAHALCWIHAERGVTRLIPTGESQIAAIDWARKEIWEIYHQLQAYQASPTVSLARDIEARYDKFSQKKTGYYALDLVLKRFTVNKQELLMVLQRPDTPLHNNLSERDIREYVKRRKVSGSTRSEQGRACRDTFASLKKTAKKLEVKFWDYLLDRVCCKNDIPCFSELIQQAAAT